MTVRSRTAIAALAFLFAACGGDSTGPSGNGLTLQQRTALSTLMTNQTFVNAMLVGNPSAGYAAAMLPMLATNIQSVGSFKVATASLQGASLSAAPAGDYTAFGGQFLITVKPPTGSTIQLIWTGIIGVNNITNPTDVITVGVIDNGATTAPGSVSSVSFGSTTGNHYATAAYIQMAGSTATGYAGTSGQVTISSASFNGGTSCPGILGQPLIKSCLFGTGTVKGDFAFTGKQVGGQTTVSVPATTFDLPSTKVTLSVDYTALGTAFSPR